MSYHTVPIKYAGKVVEEAKVPTIATNYKTGKKNNWAKWDKEHGHKRYSKAAIESALKGR